MDGCTLRTAIGGRIIDTPLLFAGPDLVDEDPQLRLGDATNALSFFWYRGPSDAFSSCVPASVTNSLLDDSGSAETTVRVPEIATTARRPSGGSHRR